MSLQSLEARKLRLAPLWWAGGCVIALLIVYGSLVPSNMLPKTFMLQDKVMHFGCYFLLALWCGGMTRRRHYPLVAIALIILGVLMEIAQGDMHFGRDEDWHDAAADTLGTIFALALCYGGFGYWMHHIEQRLGLS